MLFCAIAFLCHLFFTLPTWLPGRMVAKQLMEKHIPTEKLSFVLSWQVWKSNTKIWDNIWQIWTKHKAWGKVWQTVFGYLGLPLVGENLKSPTTKHSGPLPVLTQFLCQGHSGNNIKAFLNLNLARTHSENRERHGHKTTMPQELFLWTVTSHTYIYLMVTPMLPLLYAITFTSNLERICEQRM